MVLTREELLQEAKLKTESVDIGNGKVILVSEISAYDLITLYGKVSIENKETKETSIDMQEFNFVLLVSSLVDEKGNRLFTDDELSIVKRFPAMLSKQLTEAAKRINGLTGDEKNGLDSTGVDSTSGESQLDLATDTPISS